MRMTLIIKMSCEQHINRKVVTLNVHADDAYENYDGDGDTDVQ